MKRQRSQTYTFPKLTGPLYYGAVTKALLAKLPEEAIPLLDHEDIDALAAEGLMKKRVRAVLNLAPSMSGKYVSKGTLRLKSQGIPVFDIVDKQQMNRFIRPGRPVTIINDQLWTNEDDLSTFVSHLKPYTDTLIEHKSQLGEERKLQNLKSFAENTLRYARRDMPAVFSQQRIPSLSVSIQGRPVVVVTRGSDHVDELNALHGYIHREDPVFIGVDGGADTLLEHGYQPDVILGDMDSVSTRALCSGADIIVHRYVYGEAPGLHILDKLGLAGKSFACSGTSEDAAYLLADEAGASLIVALGSYTHMNDFLEKGRAGMGSTFLVRLKLGEKLVDAKSIPLLFPLEQKEYLLPQHTVTKEVF